MNKITSFILGAAIGCAAGVITALALAPKSGKELRVDLADCAGDVLAKKDELAQKITGEEPMTEEELRARIEEARETIAARMKANAEVEAAAKEAS